MCSSTELLNNVTTSTQPRDNEDNEPREFDREEWEDDVIGDVDIEKTYGPNGGKEYYFLLHDMSFDDAYIRSSESRRLSEMK